MLNKYLVLFALCLIGCNDILQDEEFYIAGKVLVLYAHGDGYRLVMKEGASHKFILNTTVSSVFKNGQFLIIKADPENASHDTAYYKIAYNKVPDSSAISRLSLREYHLLRNVQVDLLKKK